MAINHEQQNLPEVRVSGGRSDSMEHQSDLQIAGILRDDNQKLIKALGEDFTPIPWTKLSAEEDFLLPDDIEFKFLGKDLTGSMRKVWSQFRMSEEKLTPRDRFKRAMGVYRWVLNHRPKAVVTWTDEYPECRAALMAANELKIPSIEIIHGAFHPYYHGNFSIKSFAKWKMGSWEYRDWAKFHGMDCTVVPTGITSMDDWCRTNMNTARPIARKGLRIPDHVPVVCWLDDAAFERNPWFEQSFTDHARNVFLHNYKILESFVPDIHLIGKLHPYDGDMTPQGFQQMLQTHKIESNYTIIDDSLPISLAASDLAVGLRSTAMVFGLLVALPSVPLDFRPFFEGWAYRGFGFEPVGSPDELLTKMVNVLTNRERMGELITETKKGAVWFGTDGMASMRAARAIRALVNGKEPDELCYSNVPQ